MTARLRAELEDARRDAHRLVDGLDDVRWSASPAPGEWSVGQCVMHLNLTSHAFVPLLRRAVDSAPPGTARARMGVTGAFLWWALTLRVPVKTAEPFQPRSTEPRQGVMADFEALQDQLLTIVDAADGRDLRHTSIASPFDPRFRYNAYAALRIVVAHQRLHLRQAQAAARAAKVARGVPVV